MHMNRNRSATTLSAVTGAAPSWVCKYAFFPIRFFDKAVFFIGFYDDVFGKSLSKQSCFAIKDKIPAFLRLSTYSLYLVVVWKGIGCVLVLDCSCNCAWRNDMVVANVCIPVEVKVMGWYSRVPPLSIYVPVDGGAHFVLLRHSWGGRRTNKQGCATLGFVGLYLCLCCWREAANWVGTRNQNAEIFGDKGQQREKGEDYRNDQMYVVEQVVV